MINIHETLFQTIKDKIDKMRFVAQNDPKAFRSILNLIILNDVKEWAIYNNECKAKIDYLSKRIDEYILQHSEFIISRQPITSYTNVNTPQTILDWQRVWDNPEVKYDIERELPINPSEGFELDPTCNPQFVYFDNYTKEGYPDVKFETKCAKMDLYIDRNTGEVWYLKEDGNWAIMTSRAVVDVNWDDVKDKPTIYQGVYHELTDDSVRVELTEQGPEYSEDVKITTSEDLEDVL